MATRTRSRGFIKILSIIVIGVILLAYFHVDVRGYVDKSPQLKAAVVKIEQVSKPLWEGYLKTPTMRVWNGVVLTYIWPTIRTYSEKLTTKIFSPNVEVEGVAK